VKTGCALAEISSRHATARDHVLGYGLLRFLMFAHLKDERVAYPLHPWVQSASVTTFWWDL